MRFGSNVNDGVQSDDGHLAADHALRPDSLAAATETELLTDAQQGSSLSFGVLAARYRPKLAAMLARRRLPLHDAEDVMQETFARAYAAIGRFDIARPFGAWLTTIALNVAATQRRKRRPLPAELPEQTAAGPSPAEACAAKQDRENLWSMARRLLPAQQFEALSLRYAGEMSVEQVASRMRLQANYVKVLLYRARQALLASRAFQSAICLTEQTLDCHVRERFER